jgi:predicted porin
MKNMAGGLLALTLSAAAVAQTTTIYGVVDVGIEIPSGPTAVKRMGFGTEASKWGFRGTEDLGGGLRATYQIEGGFSADDGTASNGGRAWGRYSTVGIAGSWGEVKLGRQLTMLIPAMMHSDSFGPSWYGIGTLDSYLPNARADNAIGYMGRFGAMDIGATFSTGRDVLKNGRPTGTNCPEGSADGGACREASLMVRYSTKSWGLAYGVDQISGGANAFGGLTSSDLKDRRSVLGGYFMIQKNFRLSGGILHRLNDGNMSDRSSKISYLNGKYDLTEATSLDAEVLNLKFKQSSASANYFIARVTHKLSKRTSLYAMAARIENSNNLKIAVSPGLPSTLGMKQNGVILGVKHAF